MVESMLERICDVVRAAGAQMLAAHAERLQIHGSENVLEKSGHANFVTIYDQKIQAMLVQDLLEILPEASIIGEESGQDKFSDEMARGYAFVIDPIDGTSNFMKGYYPSVVSVGLLKDGMPEAGVIYCPASDQMFSAQKGKGAFENGRQIFVNKDPLSDCLVGLGTAPYYEDCREASMKMWAYYLDHGIDIRRSGSAAYDLCMVASGRIGLFAEARLCLWDYTAGACIVEEAGGRMMDCAGNTLQYRGKSGIIAVGAGIQNEEILYL